MLRTRTAAALLVLLAGCSSGGDSPKADRTVDVTMKNVAYSPATLTVGKGDTVTFRFTNEDTVTHDAYVGDAAAQAEHEKEMRANASHGGHGAEDGAVTVEPGKSATLTHTFDQTGTVEIGCHEPGHYGAGMKIVVTVA